MIEAIERRAAVQAPTYWPLGDVPIATGGSISMDSAAPEIITLVTGYRPFGDEFTEVQIAQDALPLEWYRAYWSRLIARANALATKPAIAVSLRERLMAVKAGLGLSTKELAEVLRCARSSLYNWLDSAYRGQANHEALERLSALERLTRHWNGYGVGALGSHLQGMALEGEDGRTLFSLLKETPLDLTRCEVALQAIAEQCRAQIAASQRVDDLVARGFGA